MISLRNNKADIRWTTLTIALLLLCLSVARASDYPVFRHIGLLDGLPDLTVEAIIQDRYGYVWIGTKAGLLRHEGDRLNLLPRDPSHPDSLPDNNVIALHAHSDGMVWAALSENGVVEIGPDLQIRRHLAPAELGGPLPFANIWSMAEDCDGRLWMAFAQGGVGVYDASSDSFRHFPQDERAGLHPASLQTQLLVDQRCRTWLVQTRQLSVFDPTRASDTFAPVYVSEADIRDVLFAAWVSPQGELLVNRGPELLSLGSIKQPAESMQPESVIRAESVITGIGGLANGQIYLATATGLVLVDPDFEASRTIDAEPNLPLGLPADRLHGANLLDAEGGLWLAVARKGLVYSPPQRDAFGRFPQPEAERDISALEPISSIAPARESGFLWVTAESSTYRLDLRDGSRKGMGSFYPDWQKVPDRAKPNFQLIETEEFMMRFNNQFLALFRPEPDTSQELFTRKDPFIDRISFIHEAEDGRYWLGTRESGLKLFDLVSITSTRFGPDQTGDRFFPENETVAMRTGPQGRRWVASQNAVYRYDATTGFRTMADFPDGPIRSLAWKDRQLWVGSDHLLREYHLAGDELHAARSLDLNHLTERTTLLKILPSRDRNREIWLLLRSGIVRLDLDSGQFRSFNQADGLALSEFSGKAAVMVDDGRIVLGGSQGVVTIDPSRLRSEPVDPPVYLRALTAGNLRLALPPGQRSPVDLTWRQNSVRFEFSALSFVDPEQIRYRVRLNGWDDDWVVLERQSSFYYSNLEPGRYRFEVQSSGPNGRWGSSGDQITVQVARPPWMSGPALLAYALLLVGAGALTWRQFSRARSRRRQLEAIRRQRHMAESQRQLIQRLNADLEPRPLARNIAAEMQRLTAAKSATIGYLHKLMPLELVAGDGDVGMSRTEWQHRLSQADGIHEQAVDLQADEETVAQVLLVAPDHGFEPDHERRLALLVDVAGQSLHNGVLLQQVRSLAEEAEQASRAKSEFLATMSHEIRTPLHGVLGMAELLHEGTAVAPRQDLLKTLRTSGQQLQRIIDDVLDISRIEAGRLELLDEPYEIVSMLEQVVDLHAPSAAAKGLELRLKISADFPLLVTGDAGRLSQILGNLVNNAVKFTREGSVELSAEVRDDEQLFFSVRDTGPGIAPEQSERLFQPFSQLDSSLTRAHSGSGLGLAICRRLADGMGGQLRLRQSPWPGSCFELRLPAVSCRPPVPLSRLVDQTRVIALVDPYTYRIVLRLARRWGFDLTNGCRLRPHSDCLVLFDARAPEMREQAVRWLEQGCEVLGLESPYASAEDHGEPQILYRALGWPLVESRLLAVLFDRLV